MTATIILINTTKLLKLSLKGLVILPIILFLNQNQERLTKLGHGRLSTICLKQSILKMNKNRLLLMGFAFI